MIPHKLELPEVGSISRIQQPAYDVIRPLGLVNHKGPGQRGLGRSRDGLVVAQVGELEKSKSQVLGKGQGTNEGEDSSLIR